MFWEYSAFLLGSPSLKENIQCLLLRFSSLVCLLLRFSSQADAATGEVYEQFSLVPDNQIEQKWRDGDIDADSEEEEIKALENQQLCTCSTRLTASDTNCHGGFFCPLLGGKRLLSSLGKALIELASVVNSR